jgi:hypothetical protein
VLSIDRSNRHGGFIFIEEFEGNKRRGSILVPEGRHGQGWSRLASELRIARLTLWEDQVFRERKAARVVAGRSFVAVVEGSTKIDDGRVKLHTQTTPVYNPKKVDTQRGLSKVCGGRGLRWWCAGEDAVLDSADCGGRGLRWWCAGEVSAFGVGEKR